MKWSEYFLLAHICSVRYVFSSQSHFNLNLSHSIFVFSMHDNLNRRLSLSIKPHQQANHFSSIFFFLFRVLGLRSNFEANYIFNVKLIQSISKQPRVHRIHFEISLQLYLAVTAKHALTIK